MQHCKTKFQILELLWRHIYHWVKLESVMASFCQTKSAMTDFFTLFFSKIGQAVLVNMLIISICSNYTDSPMYNVKWLKMPYTAFDSKISTGKCIGCSEQFRANSKYLSVRNAVHFTVGTVSLAIMRFIRTYGSIHFLSYSLVF